MIIQGTINFAKSDYTHRDLSYTSLACKTYQCSWQGERQTKVSNKITVASFPLDHFTVAPLSYFSSLHKRLKIWHRVEIDFISCGYPVKKLQQNIVSWIPGMSVKLVQRCHTEFPWGPSRLQIASRLLLTWSLTVIISGSLSPGWTVSCCMCA